MHQARPGPPGRHAPLVMGVDLGGTNMNFGVVDGRCSIVGRARGKTEAAKGLERVVDNLVRGVHEACAAAGAGLADVAAVGIAAAGAVDIPRGVILEAPNLKWTDVPLRDILAGRLCRPVVLDNDVNGAVWGEYRLGAGRGRGDLLGVWVGTGIGGGLVLNGRLHYGAFFTAGEVGHTYIIPDAPRGEREVEDLCSRTGMLRAMRRRAAEHPDSPVARLAEGDDAMMGTATIRQAYAAGDALACSVVDRAAWLLGVAIANCITVLALDTVIVGGGITEALGEPYLERIRESFRAAVFPDRCRQCELLMTELAADSALLGAALLAAESIAERAAVGATGQRP